MVLDTGRYGSPTMLIVLSYIGQFQCQGFTDASSGKEGFRVWPIGAQLLVSPPRARGMPAQQSKGL